MDLHNPDWESVRLGDIAFVQQGSSPRKRELSQIGKYPLIKVRDFVHAGGISFSRGDASFVDTDLGDRYKLEPGDSLILSAAHTPKLVGSKIGWVDTLPNAPKVFHTAEVIKVRPTLRALDHFYLFAVLLYEPTRKAIKNIVKGGHLYASGLRELPIPLPPPHEQRVIAHVLRTVQRAKEQTEQVIAATRQLKQSLLTHLFSCGTSTEAASGELKQQETQFGGVPAHWDIRRLEELALIQTGVAKGQKFDKDESVQVPYLRVANVQDGFLDLREIKTIQIRERDLDRYLLEPGDVLLTEGGDFDKLGRGHIWQGELEPCVHQNHIFAVRVNRKMISPEYLTYLVQSSYGKKYFLKVAHRTTHLASINSTKLKAFPVLLPDRQEQDQITTVLSSIDRRIEVEEQRREALDQVFKTLLHELMTGRIRLTDWAEVA